MARNRQNRTMLETVFEHLQEIKILFLIRDTEKNDLQQIFLRNKLRCLSIIIFIP